MNSKGLGQLAFEKGIYVVGASQGYQAALENSRLGHGLLTYALIIEGLENMSADYRPPDKNIYAEELLGFVRTRVPQLQVDAFRRRDIFYDPKLDEDEVVQSWIQVPKVYYPPEFDQDKLLLRSR